jgi:hypothetical protein
MGGDTEITPVDAAMVAHLVALKTGVLVSWHGGEVDALMGFFDDHCHMWIFNTDGPPLPTATNAAEIKAWAIQDCIDATNGGHPSPIGATEASGGDIHATATFASNAETGEIAMITAQFDLCHHAIGDMTVRLHIGTTSGKIFMVDLIPL